MAIAKKGSRKITVQGHIFRWRVNGYSIKSEWRSESKVLSEEYTEIAAKYGLGEIADITFHIPVELYESPASKIIIKCFGFCVDGFLGIEQLLEIKPKTIAAVIEHFLNEGWDPRNKGDRYIELYEQSNTNNPSILVIPGFMNDNVKDYPNILSALKII